MSKSKAFFILCLSFIVGIAAHSFFSPEKIIGEPFWWYVGFLTSIVAGILFWSSGRQSAPARACARYSIFFLAFFFLGFFRYSQTIPIIDEYHIAHYLGQEMAVHGVIDSLPRKREKTTAYVIKVTNIAQSFRSDVRTKAMSYTYGKLLLTAPPYPPYNFGNELFIKCTPQPLSQYEKWAVREGVSASCAFPKHISSAPSLRVRDSSPFLPLRLRGSQRGLRTVHTALFEFRDRFDTRLRSLFPDPYGGLLAGILYGDTSGLSRSLREAFRITGLAHITALSGYNITIISWVLVGGLIGVGLTRKQAMPVTLLLIIAFVLATGAEASVVRAAIMGSLTALARNVGRARHPRNALALAGVAMLAVNPRLLRFDLGFLLSFVATIALVYFADDIERRTLVRKLPKIWEIRKAGAASVSALIFTTPLLLYHTGIFGPFALLVNILVVPVVPVIMALGFLAVALDFLWHPLGLAISFLARAPLEYVVNLAEYFARFGALHIRLSFLAASVLFCLIAWKMRQWKNASNSQPALDGQ